MNLDCQLQQIEANLSQTQNFEWIVKYFNLQLDEWGGSYTGSCPIHQGDNPGAFQIWPYQEKPYWQCRTHLCHEKFNSTLIGFVRGLLSAKFEEEKYGWNKTLTFIKQNVGIKKIEIDHRANDISRANYMTQIIHDKVGKIDREYIRRLANKKENNPQYFIDRGFSPDILRHFDIFTCVQENKPLYNRCVVPIYCKDEKVLGYTGRSILPKCQKCSLHHIGECPTLIDDKKKGAKWYNLLDRSTALYNYWGVRKGPLVVAEGAGDVWRLVEHDINAVALLGASATAWQANAIARLMPPSLIVVTDDDEAGDNCFEQLENKLSRYTKVIRIRPDGHDAAESSPIFFSSIQKEVNKWIR